MINCPDGVVPISGQDLSRQDKVVSVPSKKQGTRASAGSPIDFVSAAESVRVQQNSISGLKLNRIDFGVDNGVVRAAEGN
jgi:hypothetical protein